MDFTTIIGYVVDFFKSVPWANLFSSLKSLITGVDWDSLSKLFDGFDLSSGTLQTLIDGFTSLVSSLIGG